MLHALFYFTGVAAYVVLAVWLIHIMPEKWKSTASLVITILSLAIYLFLDKSPQVTIFEDDRRVVETLKASEHRVMNLIQANEGHLDSTIKILQDSIHTLQRDVHATQQSVHALQDSVDVHPNRHLRIIGAKLDTLIAKQAMTR